MSGTAGWDRARALWILALIGGISFFAAVLMRWDGPAIWAWKTSGVALLALWAAVNARSGGGWMIAAALAFGALGDWLLDAVGMMPGAAAFAAGHVIAIALYLRNRRPRLTGSQTWLVLATVPLAIVKIGRAHVCTPVTNAHLVCRLLLEKKK